MIGGRNLLNKVSCSFFYMGVASRTGTHARSYSSFSFEAGITSPQLVSAALDERRGTPMNTLIRHALSIIFTAALLSGCGGGGGGGGTSNTGGASGGSGNTNPVGNTGGTGNPGNTGNSGNEGGGANTGGGGGGGSGSADTGGGADDSGDADDTTFPDQHPEQPLGTAEGVYAAALTGGQYSHSKALILENGQYWSLYGNDSGSFFTVYGFIQGSGISADGTYSAGDLRDFGSGTSPAIAGTMTADYDATAETLDGTWAFDNVAEIQFTGGEITDSPYDYDTPADIATAAGHWNGTSAAGPSVSITINTDGSFNMVDGQCVSTGTMKPRASGKNVFNLTIKFGDAPCAMANQTAKGVAITYPLTSTGEMQLMAAAVSPSREQGVAFFGIRD
jgi:hypothetical protein